MSIVILDFWASWCAPCKRIAPEWDALAAKHPQFEFKKVNVDDDPDSMEKHNVETLPTFVVLRDGLEIKRLIGSRPDDWKNFVQFVASLSS